MKKTLQSLGLFLIGAAAFAQATDATVSLDPDYANTVYYNLDTQTETSFAADSWDIGFLRTSAMSMGIRTNALVEVYEASDDIENWSAIDVANIDNWTQLYNDDTNWTSGAYDQGSATYGWGEYNIANHHVTGSIIFVLKLIDGTFVKFINEDYYGGYTFKYATWDGSAWSEDKTEVILNSENDTNRFNYFSFKTNSKVVAEPAMDAWHLVFGKYYTDVPVSATETMKYMVTGALVNAGITVAVNDESGENPDTSNLTYAEAINTIGYNWKSFSMETYTYDIDSDTAYYVKTEAGNIYRLVFTGFEGSSTGNLSFNFEDVTEKLSITDVNEGIAFGIYPNPTTDKKINLIYDVNALQATQSNISIYAVTGAKVFETTIKNQNGFYNKELQLNNLQSGVYILKFTSGNQSVTKKLVLR
ncbi:T9SS type A sorting domain-containing protein [Formosa sp. A9]|uniref:T9SS type A sorting domain-containing protein n=1 Tax=Formosa sp. A9 TaxID=3442641 RepID=UPI003EB7504F